MNRNNRKINAILLLLAVLTLGMGYAQGDWKKFSLHHGGGAAAQQRALDHLFGGDDVTFNPAADDVSSYASSSGDDLKWRDLAQAKTMLKKKVMGISCAKPVHDADGHVVTVTGYMFPLQGAGRQGHFLLSAYPPSCPYCLPGGPSEMIEVEDSDIPFTYEPVTLKGAFHVMQAQDELQSGVYYRLSQAEKVKR